MERYEKYYDILKYIDIMLVEKMLDDANQVL
jgi:hypothetical protein